MQSHTYADMFRLEDTHFWFVGKRLFIQKILDSLAPAPRMNILDVGCGTGGTTLLLTKYGMVTGLEQNSAAIELTRKRGLPVIRGSANALPFPSESFDLVTFIDVLYHTGISEPKALKEAYRVLKKGGILLITDCAYPKLMSHHDIVMHAKYRYTRGQLSNFVQKAGFSVRKIRYIFASLFPFFVLSRIADRILPPKQSFPSPPRFINLLCIGLLKTEVSIFPAVSFPFGSSLLLIASK